MSSLRARLFSGFVPHLMAILIAGAGCLGAAVWAKERIEAVALDDLNLALGQTGHDWVQITVDGLTVVLRGTAPNEAKRFAALSVAGTVVDASRIRDRMDVVAAAAIAPPEFKIELLNNADGISLIGLVPLVSDPESIVQSVQGIAGDAPVADLLEAADFPVPDGWPQALSFGIDTIDMLPRAKVSIAPGAVTIKAAADSPEDKARLERQLTRAAPRGIELTLNITAPRPVVAPFTLRAVIDGEGARFDACTADSEEALRRILAAAKEAGIEGGAACILGLGTPSTRWGEAAEAGIGALATLGGGTLTMSNADVALVAAMGTDRDLFERAAGDLEAALPPVFSLSAVLPEPEDEEEGSEEVPAEFIATLSPEGKVQLRGRLRDAATRDAVQSFAAATFGTENVHMAARVAEDLPAGWAKRVMVALKSLGELHNGSVTVTPDRVAIRGTTGDQNAQGEITRLLSAALGGTASYEIDVTYAEELDPVAALPTPEECIQMLNATGAKRKITFAPSSSEIDPDAQETIDAVAEILRDCRDVPIEIGGHTDSQGREVMNQQLSQARADSVLNAIMARRVLVSNLTAKGYGESRPIADNDTEEGREANRRIEFRLLTPEDIAQAAEEAAAEGEGDTAGDASDTDTAEETTE